MKLTLATFQFKDSKNHYRVDYYPIDEKKSEYKVAVTRNGFCESEQNISGRQVLSKWNAKALVRKLRSGAVVILLLFSTSCASNVYWSDVSKTGIEKYRTYKAGWPMTTGCKTYAHVGMPTKDKTVRRYTTWRPSNKWQGKRFRAQSR